MTALEWLGCARVRFVTIAILVLLGHGAALAQSTPDEPKLGAPHSPLAPSFNVVPSDPTALTTAQIDRAVQNLELRLNARLDAMDKARELADANLTRVPTAIDRAMTQLQQLLTSEIEKREQVSAERFARIDNQFLERDKRSEQLALASATAVSAALQAQKEAAAEQNRSAALAIAKSETATAEAIRQLQTLSQSESSATNEKIAALASRLDRGEGHTTGIGDSWGYLVGGLGMLVAIAGLAIALSNRRAGSPAG